MHARARYLVATVFALAALALAACGDDDDGSSNGSSGSGGYGSGVGNAENQPASSGGGKRTVLALSADPGGALKFDKSSLTAKAGKVTIVLKNPPAPALRTPSRSKGTV